MAQSTLEIQPAPPEWTLSEPPTEEELGLFVHRKANVGELQREYLLRRIAKLKAEEQRGRPPKPEPIEILSFEEIKAQDDPKWLVEGLLQEDSFALLAGPPNSYKSFLAIGIGCCVASDKAWVWHETQHGPVIYVYAEGGNGVAKRLRAWEKRAGKPAPEFYGIPSAVNMLDEASATALIAAIKAKGITPVLIILDTLQRCFGPGNENSTQDMAAFIRGCDRVRKAFRGSTLLALHHTGWNGEHERGNSALRGALDTVLRIRDRDGKKVALRVEKQKNFEAEDKPLWLELRDVEGTSSAVLRLAEPPAKKERGRDNEGKVLHALDEVYPKGLKPKELATASGVKRDTLKGVRERLRDRGKIKEDDGRIYVVRDVE